MLKVTQDSDVLKKCGFQGQLAASKNHQRREFQKAVLGFIS